MITLSTPKIEPTELARQIVESGASAFIWDSWGNYGRVDSTWLERAFQGGPLTDAREVKFNISCFYQVQRKTLGRIEHGRIGWIQFEYCLVANLRFSSQGWIKL